MKTTKLEAEDMVNKLAELLDGKEEVHIDRVSSIIFTKNVVYKFSNIYELIITMMATLKFMMKKDITSKRKDQLNHALEIWNYIHDIYLKGLTAKDSLN